MAFILVPTAKGRYRYQQGLFELVSLLTSGSEQQEVFILGVFMVNTTIATLPVKKRYFSGKVLKVTNVIERPPPPPPYI